MLEFLREIRTASTPLGAGCIIDHALAGDPLLKGFSPAEGAR
jgi:hypothetical protein